MVVCKKKKKRFFCTFFEIKRINSNSVTIFGHKTQGHSYRWVWLRMCKHTSIHSNTYIKKNGQNMPTKMSLKLTPHQSVCSTNIISSFSSVHYIYTIYGSYLYTLLFSVDFLSAACMQYIFSKRVFAVSLKTEHFLASYITSVRILYTFKEIRWKMYFE